MKKTHKFLHSARKYRNLEQKNTKNLDSKLASEAYIFL